MSIRKKLAILALSVAGGGVLILGLLFLLSSTLTKQKIFQDQTVRVLTSLKLVETETQNLLIKSEGLNTLRNNWLVSISQFEEDLEKLSQMSSDGGLSPEQAQQLRDALGQWKEIYEWYYVPALDHLNSLIDGDVGEIVGTRGLLSSLQVLLTQTDRNIQATGNLLTMQSYLRLISEELEPFVLRFLTLGNSLQEWATLAIQNAIRFGLASVLLIISITLFFIVRFSRLLVHRIHKVEKALRRMASGDFSSELNIQSGDEFQSLSKNFNTLKNQLQEKLNAVLNFMLTITTSLEEGPDLENILSIITSETVKNTGACGAAIYLIDSGEQILIPRATFGYYPPPLPLPPETASSEEKALNFARESRIPIGAHVIGIAVKETKPVFIRSASALEEGELDFVRSQDDPLCIESLIIAPLMISRRILGAIVATKRPYDGTFTDLDFTHMQNFADYAALTIDNLYNTEALIERQEMRREISIATEIQRGLLPKKLPALPSIQISAFSRAARGISGDYYDVFPMAKGRIGVIICDVVGKGVPASLLMVMIRTIVRLVANAKRTPANLLTFLNGGIIGRVGTEQFATMGIFSYDQDTRTVTYANAAHPPLLIYRSKENSFVEIDTLGLPIGVEKNERYQEKSFSVEVGDILSFFTDGIIETRSSDGREYSADGLRNRLRRCSKESAKEIIQSLREDVDNFSSGMEQHDDQTLIVMKVIK